MSSHLEHIGYAILLLDAEVDDEMIDNKTNLKDETEPNPKENVQKINIASLDEDGDFNIPGYECVEMTLTTANSFPSTSKSLSTLTKDLHTLTTLKKSGYNLFSVKCSSCLAPPPTLLESNDTNITNGKPKKVKMLIMCHLFVNALLDASLFSEFKHLSLGRVMSWMSTDWSLIEKLDGYNAKELCHLVGKENLRIRAPPSTLKDLYSKMSRPTFIELPGELPQSNMKIPSDLLPYVLSLLDAPSLYNMSLTCKLIRKLGAYVIPGLKLSLYPHQLTSVQWMLSRCSGGNTRPHPAWRSVTSRHGRISFSVDMTNGEYSTEDPPVYSLPQGGMLCDEPGLGKTITMLSVILRRARITTSSNTSNISSHNFNGFKKQCLDMTRGGLIRSGAALIIVPDALKAQWAVQVDTHISASVLADGGLFVDNDNLAIPLPSAHKLAQCLIIITTHRRLASEWRRGRRTKANRNDDRPQRKRRLSSKLRGTVAVYGRDSALCPKETEESPNYNDDFGFTFDEDEEGISPLLRIQFSDVVVDEGHEAGRGGVTDSLLMAEALDSPCRWLLTGTPTPSDPVQANRYLHHLFKFLRHPLFYATSQGDPLWRRMVAPMFSMKDGTYTGDTVNTVESQQKDINDISQSLSLPSSSSSSSQSTDEVNSILDKSECYETRLGASALQELLSASLIRHTKTEIPEIPRPVRKLSLLSLSTEEAQEYNTLVSLARTNMVTTEKDYEFPNGQHLDSLFNARNRKNLTETVKNLRLATAGAGRAPVVLTNTLYNINETKAILAKAIRGHLYARESLPHALPMLMPSGRQVDMMEQEADYFNVWSHWDDLEQAHRLQQRMLNEEFNGHMSSEVPNESVPELSMNGRKKPSGCLCGGNCSLQYGRCDYANSYMEIGHVLIKVENYIRCVLEGRLSTCDVCERSVHILMVLPCLQGHLVCPDCADAMGDYCDLCQIHFDWHVLQKLQPGFECSEFAMSGTGNTRARALNESRQVSRVANRAIASVESIPSAIPSVPVTITPFHLSTRDRVGPSHGSVRGMGVSNDLGPDHEDLLAGMTSSSKIDHLIRCIDSLESTYQSHLKQRRRIEMIQ